MADFREIALDQIRARADHRLRPVDDAHARVIASSIEEIGLLNPVTVIKTPPATKGFRPFTLIAGGHRLRAFALLKRDKIPAMVAGVVGEAAQIAEIDENLSRNDLSPLDRAFFIARRRELHEQKHGEIQAGRKGAKLAQLSLWSDEIAAVADQVGLSRRSLQRADQIARAIDAPLRVQLRGTPAAHNESLLLRLARFDSNAQYEISRELAEGKALKDALQARAPKPKKSDAQKRLSAIFAGFAALGAKDRRAAFQQLIRDYPKDADYALDNPLPEAS